MIGFIFHKKKKSIFDQEQLNSPLNQETIRMIEKVLKKKQNQPQQFQISTKIWKNSPFKLKQHSNVENIIPNLKINMIDKSYGRENNNKLSFTSKQRIKLRNKKFQLQQLMKQNQLQFHEQIMNDKEQSIQQQKKHRITNKNKKQQKLSKYFNKTPKNILFKDIIDRYQNIPGPGTYNLKNNQKIKNIIIFKKSISKSLKKQILYQSLPKQKQIHFNHKNQKSANFRTPTQTNKENKYLNIFLNKLKTNQYSKQVSSQQIQQFQKIEKNSSPGPTAYTFNDKPENIISKKNIFISGSHRLRDQKPLITGPSYYNPQIKKNNSSQVAYRTEQYINNNIHNNEGQFLYYPKNNLEDTIKVNQNIKTHFGSSMHRFTKQDKENFDTYRYSGAKGIQNNSNFSVSMNFKEKREIFPDIEKFPQIIQKQENKKNSSKKLNRQLHPKPQMKLQTENKIQIPKQINFQAILVSENVKIPEQGINSKKRQKGKLQKLIKQSHNQCKMLFSNKFDGFYNLDYRTPWESKTFNRHYSEIDNIQRKKMQNFTAENESEFQSFDSSLQWSNLSRTNTLGSVSTMSLDTKNKAKSLNDLECNNYKQQKQRSRFNADLRISQNFEEDQQPTFGFFTAGTKQAIHINRSKVKKAQKFFKNSPLINEETFKSQNYQTEINQEKDQFSLPFFSMGNGARISIGKQFIDKAQNFFLEMGESNKKFTKIKQRQLSFNNIKTINSNEQRTKQTVIINRQKISKMINWSKISKKTIKMRKPGNFNKFHFIKLSQLEEPTLQQFKKFQEFFSQKKNKPINHNRNQCQVACCIICGHSYESEFISKENCYNLCKMVNVSKQQFNQLYDQIQFKLIRYQCFYPFLQNYKFNANNMLLSLHKKLEQYKEQNSSYLRLCLLKPIGQSINLIIRNKILSENGNIGYLLLSDGWTTIWAALSEPNLLYQYYKKMYIGMKIMISHWHVHPISNILQYCSEANQQQLCIQFYYNSSILIKQNIALGKPKFLLYRPLHLCRQKGGYVAVVEGVILRMFEQKSVHKTNKFYTHFIELMLDEGYTIMMQFMLAEQASLTEIFRLYYKFQFYKIKIGEQGILHFIQGSKFHQLKQRKQQQMGKVKKLLKKRLINLHFKEIQDYSLYDIICQKGVILGCNIQVCLEGINNLNSGIMIYQQYQVFKKTENQIILKISKRSSMMRKIPKVYNELLNLL